MEKATTKQLNYLEKLGAIFNPENITKREASLLIGRTIKANKETGKHTTTRKNTTIKDNEPKQRKTLDALLLEYNCGTTDEMGGRFYKGNNADNLPSFFDGASEWLKNIKKIILKEFNAKICASKSIATHTPSYTFTLKTTPQEFYKNFDELKKANVSNWRILEYLQNHNGAIRNIFINWEKENTLFNNIINNDDLLKLYYDWCIENTDGRQMLQYMSTRNENNFIMPIYSDLICFLGALMKSYNYDHTGQFMGDCDYVDCSFFYSIDWENLHDITKQSKQIGELYKKSWREYDKLYGNTLCELKNKVYNSTTADELKSNILEYNKTKEKFLQ